MESIYLNGGMIGKTMDFGATDSYPTNTNKKNSGIWNLEAVYASYVLPSPTTSTFINSYGITATSRIYSFTTASIPAGLVAITVSSEIPADTTVTSVTIGGVSATQAAAFYQNQVDAAEATNSSIWYAIIGSSTTSVSVNFARNQFRCGIGVYTIENYTSATPVYNNAVQGPIVTTLSITTPSISSGSAIIAVRTSGNIYSHTWSVVTEDYDNRIAGGLSGQTGASLNTSTTQTHTIESVGDTAASQGTTMAVAVWS